MRNIIYNQPRSFFKLIRSDPELQERFLDLVQDVYRLEQRERDHLFKYLQDNLSNEQDPDLEVDDEDQDELCSVELQDDETGQDQFTARRRTAERREVAEMKRKARHQRNLQRKDRAAGERDGLKAAEKERKHKAKAARAARNINSWLRCKGYSKPNPRHRCQLQMYQRQY
jgi:hypothetical protein